MKKVGISLFIIFLLPTISIHAETYGLSFLNSTDLEADTKAICVNGKSVDVPNQLQKVSSRMESYWSYSTDTKNPANSILTMVFNFRSTTIPQKILSTCSLMFLPNSNGLNLKKTNCVNNQHDHQEIKISYSFNHITQNGSIIFLL